MRRDEDGVSVHKYIAKRHYFMYNTQTKIIKYRECGDCCPIFVTQSRCDNLVFTSRSLLPSLHVSNTPDKDNMYDNPKTCIQATLGIMPNMQAATLHV